MVRYDPKTWFALIFHAYSRQVMRTLMPALLFMIIYTTLLAYLDLDYYKWDLRSTTAVHSLLGIVLGLFLVFRVNSAYDRWWEGRKLWGSFVNNTRNLALKLGGFLSPDDDTNRSFFAQMIPNFVIAMKEHLRKGAYVQHLDILGGEAFLQRLKGKDHIPNIITLMIYEKINDLYKTGKFTGDQFFVLDKEVKSFSDILGGVNVLKIHPYLIPTAYTLKNLTSPTPSLCPLPLFIFSVLDHTDRHVNRSL